jgi:Cu2+-containing amine oxidase
MDSGEYGFGIFLTPLHKNVDCPVMSAMWKGITLMPFNFFRSNPAIRLRNPGATSEKQRNPQ